MKQIGERLVPRGIQVHRHAVDDILERLTGEIEPADERLQPAALRGGRRLAVVAPLQLSPPEVHGVAADRHAVPRRRRLIHSIVDRAAEVPDGNDGASLFGRQHEKRVVKAGLAGHEPDAVQVSEASDGSEVFDAFGVFDLFDVFDVFDVFHRAARQRIAGMSRAPSVGR